VKNLQEKLIKECNNLEKVTLLAQETLSLVQNLENDVYFKSLVSGLTLYLENLYMGVERVLSLIAQEVDKIVPSGGSWHLQLLQQMVIEVPSVRPAVISQETYEKLNEFRGFRHVARNLYAYDLEPGRVIELAKKLNQCHESFITDMESFTNSYF
jgi:hypothetical protein